jgi:hypothetical protein
MQRKLGRQYSRTRNQCRLTGEFVPDVRLPLNGLRLEDLLLCGWG